MPDKVTADQLIERILFIRLINERLQKIDQETGTPHQDFMREFSEFKDQLRAQKTACIMTLIWHDDAKEEVRDAYAKYYDFFAYFSRRLVR